MRIDSLIQSHNGRVMNRAQFAELNAFVAVAERTNFARAAAHLGITASTISQTIRALEERLGMRLLNRTTRSVSLTDAGEKLLERIRPAISELGAAVEDLNEFRDAPKGTLRLSVSSVAAEIVLAPVIKQFLAAYPGIALDITLDDSNTDIVTGRFDAGIRVGRLVARDMQVVRVSGTYPDHRARISGVPRPAPGAQDARGPAAAQLHQFPQAPAVRPLGVRQGQKQVRDVGDRLTDGEQHGPRGARRVGGRRDRLHASNRTLRLISRRAAWCRCWRTGPRATTVIICITPAGGSCRRL